MPAKDPPANGDTVSGAPELPATLPATGAEGELPIGTRLGSRYRIVRHVGSGGMGAVYLAFDEMVGQEVALKLVRAIEGVAELLRDEVRLAQRVNHSGVCRTFDLEEVDGRLFIKMEYVPGETLTDYVERLGSLPVDEALSIARQIAAALGAAHIKGVIHRDLKPDNIQIETTTRRIVLMDFGIARTVGGGAVSGTPGFMSPEQAAGKEIDGRSDLYSLGCLLFFMLTGKTPFDGPTIEAILARQENESAPDARKLRASTPAWLARLAQRLMERQPADRPRDAAAVAAALDTPRRRLRRIVAVGAIAVAAAGGLFALRSAQQRSFHADVRDHLPTFEENADSPAISPDGKWVAYPTDREVTDRFRIYVAPLAGGAGRAVTPPEVRAGYPRWSRDGSAILFRDLDMPRILSVHADGTGTLEMVASGAHFVDVCGDGLVIGYVSSPGCASCGRIVLRSADGGERELHRGAPGDQLISPRCDRNGRQVVFAVTPSGHPLIHPQADLWLLPIPPLNGPTIPIAPRRLTNEPQHENHAATFAPDGRSVIFASRRSGHSNLWELPVTGNSAPTQLTFGSGPDMAPDVAPDGRSLIFDVDVTSLPIFVYALDGEAPRRLTTEIGDFTCLDPSADGREVIAAVRREGKPSVVAVSVEDGSERSIGDGEFAALSVDGKEVFTSVTGPPARLLALPIAGGAPRVIADLPAPASELAAGPDGFVHLTLADAGGFEAWRVPIAGGAPERDAQAPWTLIAPAPKGGYRAGITVDGGRRMLHVLAPGISLDPPPAGIEIREFAWSRDGATIDYVDLHEVRRREVATGTDATLFKVSYASGIAPSPDGKRIYATRLASHVRRQVIANFADRARPW